jgi:hypothetical protein
MKNMICDQDDFEAVLTDHLSIHYRKLPEIIPLL